MLHRCARREEIASAGILLCSKEAGIITWTELAVYRRYLAFGGEGLGRHPHSLEAIKVGHRNNTIMKSKQSHLVRSISFAILCMFIYSTAIAQQTVEAGFTTLFNGKNLDGWVGNKQSYKVEDGMMVIVPDEGEGGGNLYTEAEYSDFILRFEFQLTPGANNGLGIHAPLSGNVAYEGKELQIIDNKGTKYGKLKPWQYHGSVYGVIAAKRGFQKPAGEWNQQEVIVNGPHIKVILNGNTIIDGDVLEASKNGTIDGKEHPGLKKTIGHIGFLGHGDVVRFRNIRIKELNK